MQASELEGNDNRAKASVCVLKCKGLFGGYLNTNKSSLTFWWISGLGRGDSSTLARHGQGVLCSLRHSGILGGDPRGRREDSSGDAGPTADPGRHVVDKMTIVGRWMHFADTSTESVLVSGSGPLYIVVPRPGEAELDALSFSEAGVREWRSS